MIEDIFFSIIGNVNDIIATYNYPIIFLLMMLESSFIPFPSEVVMIPAGYLVSKGELSFVLVVSAGVLGSIAGGLVNYYIAKTLGYKFLKKFGKYFFLKNKELDKMQKFFNTHGAISTFTGRLIPGIRQYISFPAGIASMNLNKFIFFTALGSGIWMIILTITGMLFAHNEVFLKENLFIISIVLLIFVIICIVTYVIIFKRKNRK